MLHDLYSMSSPGQGNPPGGGFGLLQRRVRFLVPPSQETLHPDHSLHVPQLPSEKNQHMDQVFGQSNPTEYCIFQNNCYIVKIT